MKYLDPKADLTFKKIFGTFIELPKFTPQSMAEKRMAILWLRFLTEINSSTREAPSELLDNPEINKALEEVEVTAFTEDELRAYDRFWDTVRTEKTLQHDSYQEGRAEGRAEGELSKAKEIARNMLSLDIPIATIAKVSGLDEEEIKKLKNI